MAACFRFSNLTVAILTAVLIIFIVFQETESLRGRSGGGGAGRTSSSSRSSSSRSSRSRSTSGRSRSRVRGDGYFDDDYDYDTDSEVVKTDSSLWRGVRNGIYFGSKAYMRRRRWWNLEEPVVCSKMYYDSNGTSYSSFLCPMEGQEDDMDNCCGDEGEQKCCTSQTGIIIGITIGVVMVTLLLCYVTYRHCTKTKTANPTVTVPSYKTCNGNTDHTSNNVSDGTAAALLPQVNATITNETKPFNTANKPTGMSRATFMCCYCDVGGDSLKEMIEHSYSSHKYQILKVKYLAKSVLTDTLKYQTRNFGVVPHSIQLKGSVIGVLCGEPGNLEITLTPMTQMAVD